MEISDLNFEGTPPEIAEQIFKKLIGPMFDHLAKTNPKIAIEFGYCIAGNGIACYLNSIKEVNQAEKSIIQVTQSMAADIKHHRNKVC
ncbi:MAG: hypothetical protein GAK29_02191 [Acinetobacter bereziniae]|uniref:Uncharacterized protein n=1 Tax=Acinetobacter bereziniae TaxID=106648 RepID=A0A833PEU1_ACIBZ|nr:MAG: hypothetical protein GAK29_02191 [Acinetobacter bereziniae]